MIVHQLRFGFRPETTEEQKAEVLAVMRRTASVESVSFGTVGPLLGAAEDGLTHGYSVGIADLAAMERYIYDPAHLEGDPLIVPHLDQLVIGPDLSDDTDPGLWAKIGALNEAKLAAHPEWATLLGTIPRLRVIG
ncbi:Dabb family protein [Nocardia bovistercoris]|uniref:Dabb family protein n=1 Tax=Nocardia bovistercoris TaxID=2785916 RepID=A0A931N545_9NOCA|nr:Dabb family protein [Nocardia bovistercoris]MBH0779479.1 Dabb family protein [Nocardia bovistercoris]